MCTFITEHIILAAEKSIPQSSSRRINPRPWWNSECEDAKKKQNKAWNVFSRYPTAENLVAFKRCKVNGRRIRRITKRMSWTNYLSSINSYTDAKKVYDRVRKLTGNTFSPLPLVNECGNTLEEQADTLGEHFEYISSSQYYTKAFSRYKKTAELKRIHTCKAATDACNQPFSMHELKISLDSCKNSAPGADRMVY